LAQSVGKPLVHEETSAFDREYFDNGSFPVAYRPSLWKHKDGGREFFATVFMHDGKISKVK
jgi:hypothetical protein